MGEACELGQKKNTVSSAAASESACLTLSSGESVHVGPKLGLPRTLHLVQHEQQDSRATLPTQINARGKAVSPAVVSLDAQPQLTVARQPHTQLPRETGYSSMAQQTACVHSDEK